MLNACHRGLRFSHVSVSFDKRDTGKSFISMNYPFKVIPQIMQVIIGIKPLRVFAPIGGFFLVVGILIFTLEISSYLLGYTEKPVQSVNLVLGSCLFGLQILSFGFLADLVVKMNRNLIDLISSSKSK